MLRRNLRGIGAPSWSICRGSKPSSVRRWERATRITSVRTPNWGTTVQTSDVEALLGRSNWAGLTQASLTPCGHPKLSQWPSACLSPSMHTRYQFSDLDHNYRLEIPDSAKELLTCTQ